MYQYLADLVLTVHFLFVAFVVVGLLIVIVARWTGWTWAFSLKFRLLHLLAIAIVVVQAWLGQICPLTLWENELRVRAGQMPYEHSFVQDWLHRLLFYDAELWVFVLGYTIFAAVVAGLWWRDRHRLHW
ncbi:MAG: DUF2784 domain-containing protein [Gammaproteobacteria bacterium]